MRRLIPGRSRRGGNRLRLLRLGCLIHWTCGNRGEPVGKDRAVLFRRLLFDQRADGLPQVSVVFDFRHHQPTQDDLAVRVVLAALLTVAGIERLELRFDLTALFQQRIARGTRGHVSGQSVESGAYCS